MQIQVGDTFRFTKEYSKESDKAKDADFLRITDMSKRQVFFTLYFKDGSNKKYRLEIAELKDIILPYSNVLNLTDLAAYRRVLSKLDNDLTNSRKLFIDSLSLAQYKKFNKLFRLDRINLDITKVTKDKNKIDLYNNWCYNAYRVNCVNGTQEQYNSGYNSLKIAA